ncbi:MAG: hypothetical protein NVS1B14_06830 [Vulcanimicrobiaceae bacterium]
MSLELLNALAPIGTFAVLAITAVAAVVQLRHIRVGNQLGAVLTVMKLWQTSEIQDSLDYVRRDLPAKLTDPEYLRAVESGIIEPQVRIAIDFHEQLGYFLHQRLIHDSFLGVYSPTGSAMWERLSPIVFLGRRRSGNSYIQHFEYFAARERQWKAREPGLFSGDLARLPLRDPWAELTAAKQPK